MNRLPATITAVQASPSVTLVEAAVGSVSCAATLLGAAGAHLAPGMPVTLMFKEAEVALAKNLSGLLSMRNRLPCRITAIESGELLTRINLDFEGRSLSALITSGSARRMALVAGDAVEALIKANEMYLQAGEGA